MSRHGRPPPSPGRGGPCRGLALAALLLLLVLPSRGAGAEPEGGGPLPAESAAPPAAGSPDKGATNGPGSSDGQAAGGEDDDDNDNVPVFFVDRFHGGVTRGLLVTATWLDSFFGDERYEAEANDSYFRVSNTVLHEDGIWTRYRPDYQLRLVLPQLRQKTRLVISGDLWTEDESAPSGLAASSPPPQDREVNTSLQVVLPSHNRHSTTVRGGTKYSSGEMVYYAGPRYRYLLPFQAWTARFTENMLWESGRGWESKTRVDLERPLPPDLFFRISTEGTWTEGTVGYLYSITALLRQPLDPARVIEYDWVNSFHTRPITELTEIKLVFRYRQQIWRQWLFLEIAPQYRFPRDREFEATPGINFKLELFFGGLT